MSYDTCKRCARRMAGLSVNMRDYCEAEARKGYVKLEDVVEILNKTDIASTWTDSAHHGEYISIYRDYLIEQIKALAPKEYNSKSEMRRVEHMKKEEE